MLHLERAFLMALPRQSRPIVTKEGMVAGVLAGQVDGLECDNGTLQKVCEELLDVLHFEPNEKNRRGPHKSCISGISLGGGQPVSTHASPLCTRLNTCGSTR